MARIQRGLEFQHLLDVRCVDKPFVSDAVLPVYVVGIRDDVLRLIPENGMRNL